jgi:hypothetical protein
LVDLILKLKGSLVNKDTCSEVLLGRGLVFAGCLLKDLLDLTEVIVTGALMAVDLILKLRLGG